jgi:hypothetical protein
LISGDFSKDIAELDFLDFSVCFGRPPIPFTRDWVEKSELVAEMKRVGIRQARSVPHFGASPMMRTSAIP